MFEIEPPRSNPGASPDAPCSITYRVFHESADTPYSNDLRDGLMRQGAMTVDIETSALERGRETTVVVRTQPVKKDVTCRIVNSHFHVLNLKIQIDHNEDSARSLIFAAALERMGDRMLARLRNECVIDMRARDYIIRDRRILGPDELDPAHMRQLKQELDLVLMKIAAIDEATGNRFA